MVPGAPKELRTLSPQIDENGGIFDGMTAALTCAGTMIHSFRDLDVWRKGVDLAIQVYKKSEKLPRSEMFGLTSQLRRAAVSIPANIAEGKAIGGKSYPRHLKIAMGSESELQTQIEIARRLNFLTDADADDLLKQASEVGRMLAGLFRSLPRR
jgi:four helix bundle protein